MCWLVSKGYCRYTCGLCGVDVTTAPCSQDPQHGTDYGEPNPGGCWVALAAWVVERR